MTVGVERLHFHANIAKERGSKLNNNNLMIFFFFLVWERASGLQYPISAVEGPSIMDATTLNTR